MALFKHLTRRDENLLMKDKKVIRLQIYKILIFLSNYDTVSDCSQSSYKCTPSFFVKPEKTLQDFKRGLLKQFSLHVQADMVHI